MLPESAFKILTPEEEQQFRQWARDNYEKGRHISSAWHPVIRDECRKINFPCWDRVLHLSDMCAEKMPGVRAWAEANGHTEKLDKALEYLRTYSGGPEAQWRSHLHLDMFFDIEKPSFTCSVERLGDDGEWRQFMLIGMIWFDNDKDWSFHS